MAKTSPTRVLLVRCAQTEWDAANRLQGAADLPLCEQGRAWASGLGERLASNDDALPKPDMIHHAPDEASTETARLLAIPTKAKAKECEDLRAMSLGLWEGLRREELLDRHPRNFGQWQTEPGSINPPEADSFASTQSRLSVAFARLAEKHPRKRLALVLRPIEFEILRRALLALDGQTTSEPLWHKPDECSTIELFTIQPSDLQRLHGTMKANA